MSDPYMGPVPPKYVYVVIEWEGNSQTVDGMTIRGVYQDVTQAEYVTEALAVDGRDVELQRHELA